MKSPFAIALALGLGLALAGCDSPRKDECERLLSTMKPLDEGTPSAETVERVRTAVDAMRFEDQPLDVYAKNYKETLTVLANALKLKAGDSPPDGADDVVKAKLRIARTARVDTARYCAK
jgi:hypothetical protein